MTLAPETPRLLDLTPEQREIVEWTGGPLMVLAGAGTGKTTVIVERVRWLLESEPNLAPENVLVLTYNVKAAQELTDRFARRLGAERAGRLTVANFHTFGYRILRDHGAEIGLPQDVEVLDDVAQRLLLLDMRPTLDLRYHVWGEDPSRLVSDFAALVSRAKDELVTPEMYRAFADGRRGDFDDANGAGSYAEALESMLERGMLKPAREVRGALGKDSFHREARKAARKAVRGDGAAGTDNELTPAQRIEVDGLAPTLERDAAALDVLRIAEEAEVYAAYQAELGRRGALDFGEQIHLAIHLLESRPNILRRASAPVPARARRRVPGREHRADPPRRAHRPRARSAGSRRRRGRRRPVDLPVPRRELRRVPSVRGPVLAAPGVRAGPPRGPRGTPTAPPEQALRRQGAVCSLPAHRRQPGAAQGRPGPLLPSRPPGEPVELIVARSEEEEAEALVGRIRLLFATLPDRIDLPDGRSRRKRWSDVAVLYRMHHHRELIVDRLRRAGIPHTVVGGSGLFLQPEIRDLESALRVLVDPEDSVSFARLLSAAPWRLDAVEILRVTRAAAFDRRPAFVAASEIVRSGVIRVDGPPPAPAAASPADPAATGAEAEPAPPPVRTHREVVDARLRGKLERLLGVVDDLAALSHREGPATILDEYVVRTGILTDLLSIETPEAQRTALGIARLLRFVADWQRDRPRSSLADFIAYLDVYQQMGGDLDLEPVDRGDVDGVQLMTVYQAKGLEYEVVLVPRLVERQFPSDRGSSLPIPVELLRQAPPTEYAIAEERRLLFVAMTRARQRLVLSAIDGTAKPSRFAAEVAPEGGEATDPAVHGGVAPTIARWGGGPDDVVVTVLAPRSPTSRPRPRARPRCGSSTCPRRSPART